MANHTWWCDCCNAELPIENHEKDCPNRGNPTRREVNAYKRAKGLPVPTLEDDIKAEMDAASRACAKAFEDYQKAFAQLQELHIEWAQLQGDKW